MRPARRVARPCRSRRGGYALVFLGLFLIGILAIATLVVDVALARMTQDQMQTAVEASALAGLRINTTASAGNDIAAHTSASFFTSLAFADPSGETSTGEGPLIPASPTPGMPSPALYAGESLDLKDAGPYNAASAPPLQPLALNAGNAANGDIVSGFYSYDGVTHLNDLEASSYARTDFTAGPPSPALLVRLRRVNSVFGTKNPLDNAPGVSTSGPAINFLFGHGTFIHGTSDNATYSPMRDGLAVRATAIAALRTATAVGWPDPTVNMVGAASFAVQAATWQAGGGGAIAVTFDGVTVLGSYTFVDGLRVPEVGGRIAVANPPTLLGAAAFPAYVPLFATTGGNDLIVGFVYVTVTPTSATSATLTPLDTVGENATAAAYDGIEASTAAGLAPAVVVGAVTAAFTNTPFLLQAPALVR